ncbi:MULTISPECIES: hypothetical protein [unclassified Sphingomonas]|uniref:hypothetical protein n=1 Tax=Sphingomonas TaxID=13687 RepID=UPI00095D0B57|nr:MULTISPECIES: hypothetical protein [unclassified Sphingomonas]MBN8813401.1 hypothetical protein [Sphingomonas sp.]OJY52906.1 MAG: hypothetical protein BGP17_04575 [Sphingomonas sp. 67-41]
MPQRALALFLTNAVGIGLFLALASQFWIEPECTDVPDGFAWFVEAAPVFGAFALVNWIWLFWAGGRCRRLAVLLIVAIPGCWALPLLVDNAWLGL